MNMLIDENFRDLLRNNNAVELLEQLVGRAKRAREIQHQISSMETFWSVPLKHIVDGKQTEEPVKLDANGYPLGYISLKPIRLTFDAPPVYKDPFTQEKMKRVFELYCEHLQAHGFALPSFSTRFSKLRFYVKSFLKRYVEYL